MLAVLHQFILLEIDVIAAIISRTQLAAAETAGW
jgi:hypothetical protein